jgi:DNA repair protein RadC
VKSRSLASPLLPGSDGGEIGGLRCPGRGALFARRDHDSKRSEVAVSRRAVREVALLSAPTGERPRERLLNAGPAALNAAELIALVLGSGNSTGSSIEIAERLVSRHGALADLATADVLELASVRGVGPGRAAQLVAAFELGRRSRSGALGTGRWMIRSPRDVADRLIPEMSAHQREELSVLLLNAKNVVLRSVTLYVGNVSAAVVRIAELFRDAVRIHAAGIVIVHNHPSGEPEPSPDDLALTAEAIAAGRLLDIRVLDHVIVAGDGFVSLRDRGVAFDRR